MLTATSCGFFKKGTLKPLVKHVAFGSTKINFTLRTPMRLLNLPKHAHMQCRICMRLKTKTVAMSSFRESIRPPILDFRLSELFVHQVLILSSMRLETRNN